MRVKLLHRSLWYLALAVASLFALLTFTSWHRLENPHQLEGYRNPTQGLLSSPPPKSPNLKGWLVLSNNVTVHVGNSNNMQDHQYTLNTPHLCTSIKNNSGVSLLIFVASSSENFNQRQAIRDTWGLLALQKALNYRLVFLLGKAVTTEGQGTILEEAYRYGDIVQENFTESFHNLAIKSTMGLKWASTYCSNVQYVMKTDDDIFIHVPNLLEILHTSPRERFLLCHANRVRKILRKEFMNGIPPSYKKYQVTEQELPGSYFPPYCAGLGYVASGDVVQALYRVSLVTSYFFIEDVYVTGFCREKLGLPLIDHPGFTLRPPVSPSQGGCAFQDQRVTTQEMRPQELYELWKEMNTQGFFCPHVLGYVLN